MRHALVVSLFLLGAGCAAESADPTEKLEGLSLTEQTSTHLAGSFVRGDVELRFDLAVVDDQLYRFVYEAPGFVVIADLDYSRGEGDIRSSGVVTDDLVEIFEQLHFALGDILPDDGDRFADAIARNTSLMSVAPVDIELGASHFVAERGWTHISCSCYNQYIGAGHYRQAGMGGGCTGGSGNGCKGRCGIGCGSGNHGAYTQDCARHDYGLLSWTNASDDFSFASWNC